ncbi:hypothetical protein BDY21DRAFT_374404 [Lineolata rhizophorae]|uniref:Helix-turn-helix domain-containing protein n=1 Tax=Lineolata rhizophorae TaxID=578093 RepID=A0A6A6NRC1_9PEZI|nr:hypothetical protein BDY21DRAFT_374404 [Lineolata rhizophorae]
MGSSASKAARRVPGASAPRRYPSRPPPSSISQPPPPPPPPPSAHQTASSPSPPPADAADGADAGPRTRPPPQASSAKDEAVLKDASDPTLAAHLRRLGPVAPNPFQSAAAAAHAPELFPRAPAEGAQRNPALAVVEARRRLEGEKEREEDGAGREGFEGRGLVDALVVGRAVRLREEGVGDVEVEGLLGLRRGVVGRLGRRDEAWRVVGSL